MIIATPHIRDPLLYKLPMIDVTQLDAQINEIHAEIKEYMTHDQKTIRPITNSTSSKDLAHKVWKPIDPASTLLAVDSYD